MKDLLVDVHALIVKTLNLNISVVIWKTPPQNYAARAPRLFFFIQIIVFWRCLCLCRRELRLSPFQNESLYRTIQLEISLTYLTQKIHSSFFYHSMVSLDKGTAFRKLAIYLPLDDFALS